MWTRLLLRLWKQIRIGFLLNLPKYDYVVSGKWPMIIALFCSVSLHWCPGNKAEGFWDSGSSAQLVAASTGFSSICLLLMLTQCPPLLLCMLMSRIFSLLVCHCKRGRNKADSVGLKGCKWLLIPRLLALLEVGVRKGCVFEYRHERASLWWHVSTGE